MANGDPTVNTPLLRALVGLGTGPGLPDVAGGLTLLDLLQNPLNRQDLIAQATAPTEFPEAVQPQQMGRGQRIGLTIADALQAYAAGLNPNVRPQRFIDQFQALAEFRAQQATERQERQAIEEAQAGRERARLQLGGLEQQRRRKDIREAEEREILRGDVRQRRALEIQERQRREDLIADFGGQGLLGDLSAEQLDTMSESEIVAAANKNEIDRRKREGDPVDTRFRIEDMGLAGNLLRNYVRGDQGQGLVPLAERLKSETPEQIIDAFELDLLAFPSLLPGDRRRLIQNLRERLASVPEQPVDEPGPQGKLGVLATLAGKGPLGLGAAGQFGLNELLTEAVSPPEGVNLGPTGRGRR